MADKILHAQMLGTFALSYGDKEIICNNRSSLLWNLLAYLLCHHNEIVSTEALLPILWKQERSDKPAGAMRTAIYRVRSLLSELTEDASFQFLISKDGGYAWNPDVKIVLDIESFDKQTASITAIENDVEAGLQALDLYLGKFLPMFSSEMWVVPIQTYYHNLYLSLLDWIMPRLEQEGCLSEGVLLCNKALQIDPYSEKIYQHLMRFLLLAGEKQEVVQVYKEMNKQLLSAFAIEPNEESRALYLEALNSIKNSDIISPEAAIEDLSEHCEIRGALVCDYAFFKMLYQAKARSIVRNGDAIHTVLLTLKSRKEKEIAAKSLNLAMDNLEKHLYLALRKGDVLARCSSSQFIIMLPSANYENSCKVCQRFIASFERKYPHSPVYIDYHVQAIVPSTQS